MMDKKNNVIILVENDPLGKALGVRAFHKKQIFRLISSQFTITNLKDNFTQTQTFLKGMNEFTTSRICNCNNCKDEEPTSSTTSTRQTSEQDLTSQYTKQVPRTDVNNSQNHRLERGNNFTISEEDNNNTKYTEHIFEKENVSMAYTQEEDSLTSEKEDDMYAEEFEVESCTDETRPPQANGKGHLLSSANDSDSEIPNQTEPRSKKAKLNSHKTPVECTSESTHNTKEFDETMGVAIMSKDIKKCLTCELTTDSGLPLCINCWLIRKKWIKRTKKKGKLVRKTNNDYQSSTFMELSSNDVCKQCLIREPNGTFIHKRNAHQGYCYTCTKNIWREKGSCPVCNKRIERVIKIFK